MRSHDTLRDLVRHQHGAVARPQLTELGFDKRAVARAVASGRLEPLSARVFRVGGSPDSPRQRAMAATLDAPGSAVALLSAVGMYRVPGFRVEPLHVLTSRRPHRDRAHLARMHSSVRLVESDVVRIDAIPTTTPLRTLKDLSARVALPRLDLICDRLLSLRLLRLEVLHSCAEDLPRRGGGRGTQAMRSLILKRPEGYQPAESNTERRFEQVVEQAGDPPFERQVDLGDDEGWIGRVDFVDRHARVIVEVQSALFHAGIVDRERDAVRLGRLRRAGWMVVEVTDDEVWNKPPVVVGRVRAARRQAARRARPI